MALLLAGCAGGPPKTGPGGGSRRDPECRGIQHGRAILVTLPGAQPCHVGRQPQTCWSLCGAPVVTAMPSMSCSKRDSIENFVDNFDEPSSMVNHCFGGDLRKARPTLGRFTSTPLWACSVCSTCSQACGPGCNTLEMDTVLCKADIGDGALSDGAGSRSHHHRQLVGFHPVSSIPYALLTFPLVVHWALDGLRADRSGAHRQR